ncbi:MAG: DNA gyrase inhibitor YacG [Anaerolineae bacterium]|nr:DNA gyrase inhibitor YacG [Phycisphaerae bacterium]
MNRTGNEPHGATMQCAICKRDIAESDPQAKALLPFCSERCKLIDLGRWLNGKYQIPVDESARETSEDERD